MLQLNIVPVGSLSVITINNYYIFYLDPVRAIIARAGGDSLSRITKDERRLIAVEMEE